ncbi:MAG: bifunctional 2',3'-cyclic-nucleotide 2'-phosphodiesterase/3'-nucleotidase [Rhodobacteraceae bacterium]|nr:bifunctional 2',3'-cyclic-nucleotide 2'-phosphodiesterase/3'-nucleotidase [Paracoccaceae bacterium]QPI84417.1 bifunctional 2',3'-cyclic-nucleotide 2'-phosphodiesterase/3'-nucleotidase [Rhodobacterales bacterium HKCCA1288]
MAAGRIITRTARSARLKVTLFATTDLHAHLTEYDYFHDTPDPTRGLDALAPLIARLRGAFPNSLLLDNGDTFQGTPLGDLAARESGPHPIVAAMNALQYDAMGLGNHDFNYGLDFTQAIAKGANFPVVLSNVEGIAAPAGLAKSHMLTRNFRDEMGRSHEIKIGLLALVPPQILQWDRALLKGRVTVTPIAEQAAITARALKSDGADIVVALCHSGIDRNGHDPSGENAAAAVARIPEIDALIFGHTHRLFPDPKSAAAEPLPALDHYRGRIHGKPAVQPKFWGRGIGLIHLTLAQDGDAWRAIEGHAAHHMLRPKAVAKPPQTPIHDRVIAHIRRPLGQTETRLTSYFSMITPCAIGTLLADAQRKAAAHALTEIGAEDLPLLSAVAPYKAGGRAGPDHYIDIPAGDLTRKHAAEICLYPNSLEVVEVTGADIVEWLERSASAFVQITGHGRPELIDPRAMSYNFDTLYGLSYEINLAQPARFDPEGVLKNPHARRIENITYQDAPLRSEMRFHVATNSYRAGGGGHFTAPARGIAKLGDMTPMPIEEILCAYLSTQSPLAVTPKPVWRFTPLNGAKALFSTSPTAREVGKERDLNGLAYCGVSAQGFAQFEITL